MHHTRTWGVVGIALFFIGALAVFMGPGGAAAKNPPGKARTPLTQQQISGFPLTITVQDDTRMEIDYRDPASYQFFDHNAEGAYLWVNIGGVTTVFGPNSVPAGRSTNTYTAVSNTFSGAGTPSNPWLVTTVNDVPGTPLRLTQRVSYVNGAEFTGLSFQLQQISGSTPITATLFHAADLYTNFNDSGYGYYDSSTHGIGDYVTATNGLTLYQEFVPNPNTPPSAYMEAYYGSVWDAIGTTGGPGAGFDNSVVTDTLHDSGAGLQWNLTVPPVGGSVTVGDTDLFSPHASLCGSFSDVPYGSFNYDYIYYLACNGIVSGYNDTTFRPGAATTRGQLAKIASNSVPFSDTVSGQIFTDVPASNIFYPFVQRLASRGLISGYTCGGLNEPCDGQSRPYYRPSVSVSRAQIAKILANAKGLNGTPAGQTFTDVPQSNTFWPYVERLAGLGTISGYTCGGTNPDTGAAEPCDTQSRPYFRLNSNATRGQIAKIDKLTFFPALRQR